MKKYFGKREWCETLYYTLIDEDMFDSHEDYLQYGFEGYELGWKFDWKHILGFQDRNEFHDTNDFITYTETFNVYQKGKI